MKNRITVKRAAELLGTSELTVRYGIERVAPIGTANHTSSKSTNYHIAPNKLAKLNIGYTDRTSNWIVLKKNTAKEG